jgi:hypothetical protein
MAEEAVQLLTNIGGGPSTDGKAVVLVCTTPTQKTTFGVPLQDIPTVIGFLLQQAVLASSRCTPEHLGAVSQQLQGSVPQATSMALGPSDVAQNETLYIRFGHIEVRTLIHVDKLAALAEAILGPRGKPN